MSVSTKPELWVSNLRISPGIIKMIMLVIKYSNKPILCLNYRL